MSEVLQIEDIFINVEYGKLADKKLIEEKFPKMTREEVMELILNEGEMQLGEKEREVMLDNIFKEVVTIVQSKLVHPDSKRPYSVEAMRAAMKSVNFNAKLNATAKKQAIACMKKLQNKYLVVRAAMLLQIKLPAENWTELKRELSEDLESEVKQEKVGDTEAIVTYEIDPSKYCLIFSKKSEIF